MKDFFSNLKITWKYEKSNRKNIILLCIFEVIMTIIRIVVPLLSARKIIYLTDNLLNKLAYITIMLFLVETFYDICRFYRVKQLQIIYMECQKKMQLDMGKNLLKLENDCLDKNSSGKFVQRLTNDIYKISDIFVSIIVNLSELIREVGIYIAIFIINKEICVVVILLLLIKTHIERTRTKKMNEMDKELRKTSDKLTTFATEMIRGSRDVKMLNAENGFLSKLKRDTEKLNQDRYNKININRVYEFFRGLMSDIEDLVLILCIILFIKIDRLDITLAIVIYNYFNNTGGIAFVVGEFLEKIRDFNLSCDRVYELFDDNKYKKEKFGNEHIDNIKGEFEFKNVSFKYDSKEVLKDVSFKVHPNETVAFVGKSGSGKTTIFNLLCKMYNADNGSITIDGINIKDLDKESIRGNITIISQSPYIFNVSIIDNFKLVKSNVKLEEIKEACRVACLDEFIESLPDKYNTIIGEGGINLSGGERQRLAIARALIQNTKIILFDEATSALDNETQDKISNAINNMRSDYTILIIAHRLSTVINADRILYLEDGCITAEGSHKQLLKSSPSYKKLYEKELK